LYIEGLHGVANITIFDMTGAKLRELQLVVPGRIQSDGLPVGTYLFVIASDLSVARHKVLITED
jgi:hypothetical protein